MFISEDRKKYLKTICVYLGFSVFCAVFSLVYAQYSHEVHSYYMTFLFSYPLFLGVFVYLCAMLLKLKIDRTAYNIYNSAVGTLAVGSTLRGIFEIAGTDSPFEKVFWILGFSMIALSGIIYICRAIRYRKTKNKKPGS